MLSRSAITFLSGSVLGSALVAASASAQSIPYTAPAAAPSPVYQAPQPQPGYGYTPVIPPLGAAPAPPAAAPTPSPTASGAQMTLDQQLQQMPPAHSSGTPAPAYGQAQPMTPPPAGMATPPATGGMAYNPAPYPAPMPAPQALNQATPSAANDSFFISGGVGKAERERMEAMKNQYNFKLQMATSGGAFVSGVNVQITDAKGNKVLETVTDGPLLMAKLPAGSYTVTASKFGETKTQKVQLGGNGSKTVNVFWKQDAA